MDDEDDIQQQDRFKVLTLQHKLELDYPHLKVNYFRDTGRGIMCTEEIEKDSVLIALPICHLITPNVDCDLLPLLNIDHNHSQLVLTAWLIYEEHLNKASKYFEYLETLPRCYTNLYFCTSSEGTLLPNFMKEILDDQRKNVKKIYMNFLSLLRGKKCPHCNCSLKQLYGARKFLWAWFTVNTRSLYYKDEFNRESLALAPFLDLFNHSDWAETDMSIDHLRGLYILKTSVKFNKYDQVFIKYGCHSNVTLLLEYGFIVPDNVHDFVEFSFLEVVDTARLFNFDFDDMTKQKYDFIIKNKLNENLAKNKDEFSWHLKGLVYVLITKDKDLSTLETKIYSNNFSSSEEETMSHIEKMLVENKLSEFRNHLMNMETVEECTESFLLAKNLLKMYIKILE